MNNASLNKVQMKIMTQVWTDIYVQSRPKKKKQTKAKIVLNFAQQNNEMNLAYILFSFVTKKKNEMKKQKETFKRWELLKFSLRWLSYSCSNNAQTLFQLFHKFFFLSYKSNTAVVI